MKRILSTLAAVVTAGFALAVPVAAHANVPVGGGSAPITIYAQPFTAYGCVYAGPAHGVVRAWPTTAVGAST